MNWKHGVVLKSERELRAMQAAGRVNTLALAAAVAIVEPGVTTSEIDEAAAAVLSQHGAKAAFLGVPGAFPYPAVTTVCVNDELVHAIPGRRKLQAGDIVSIDCGSIVDGFVGDSALTVPVGEVSEEAQRLMEVTEQALYLGIQQMLVGNRTGDVSAAIQEQVEANGFNVVREYTGHGVGRSMHEEPQVPNYGTSGRGIPLRAGMTIALEPMVLAGGPETKVLSDGWAVASADNRLTAHFEHTVAVTDEGPRILTNLDTPPKGIGYNRYFANRPVAERG
jgi:methionyl aminopeptidase